MFTCSQQQSFVILQWKQSCRCQYSFGCYHRSVSCCLARILPPVNCQNQSGNHHCTDYYSECLLSNWFVNQSQVSRHSTSSRIQDKDCIIFESFPEEAVAMASRFQWAQNKACEWTGGWILNETFLGMWKVVCHFNLFLWSYDIRIMTSTWGPSLSLIHYRHWQTQYSYQTRAIWTAATTEHLKIAAWTNFSELNETRTNYFLVIQAFHGNKQQFL